MWCSCKLYFFVIFTIFHKHSSAQLHRMSSGAENEHVQKSDDRMTDNLAEGDEHHKIVILVPQFLHQDKKKPKSHHHHHKVLPVVHSGKVIHAHHHHGKVDHAHGHKGHAKHEHKHHLSADHKHHHHGVGSHKHSHVGKALHDHKHAGKAHHKHGHAGKGIIHHVHSKHHHHPPPPKKPKKKFTDPFAFGGGSDADEALVDAAPRVKIDSEVFRALNPADVGSPYVSRPHSPRIIQIRIPDENENVVKEIDIDTQSDLAVLKKNYIAYVDDGDDNYGDNIDLTANLDELGAETEDTDVGGGELGHQLGGDGYKFASTATAARAQISTDDNNPVYNVFDRGEGAGIGQIQPSAGLNNGIAYSDSYRYQ